MLFDIKYALRQLLKAPAFSAVAVMVLALGIASNTAVFTVIEALLLRGLPVSRPEELFVVSAKGLNEPASLPVYEGFRDEAVSLSGIAAFAGGPRLMVATGFGRNDVIPAFTSMVSGNFFSMLSTPPFLGRMLAPADDRNDAPSPVTVLSYDLWRKRFGGDPGVLGRTISIDNVQFSIVGVAPKNFSGVQIGSPVDLWIPLHMDPILNPDDSVRFHAPTAARHYWLWIIGRIRPGISLGAAEAELNVLYQGELVNARMPPRLFKAYGMARMSLSPGGSGYITNRDRVKSLLGTLFVVVVMVLGVSCANVASLLLARMNVRQREFAVRAAIGATHWRLMGQFLIEGLLLGVISGGIGLILAQCLKRILIQYLPGGASLNLGVDGRILAFALLVSTLTGVTIGLLAGARFARPGLVKAIKDQSAAVVGGSGEKLSQVLVAAQIAVSLCLLTGAGLFVRTLQNLDNVDLGFKHKNLIVTEIQFAPKCDDQRRIIEARELWLAVRSQPGISDATFCWLGGGLLTHEGDFPVPFKVDGVAIDPEQPAPKAHATYVGPDFLQTLGVPVLRGHGLGMDDVFPPIGLSGGARMEIVIDESVARRFFGRSDPIGHEIYIPSDGPASAAYRVVGMARNTRQLDLRQAGAFEFFLPYSALKLLPGILSPPVIMLEMRTPSNPRLTIPGIRKAIDMIDPGMRIIYSTTIDDTIAQSIFPERMMAETASLFGLFALALASLGLYGSLAYNVAQRTRELGVRMALGARPAGIIGLVLRRGMTLTVVGCLVGAILASGLGHLLSRKLYNVPAADPLTLSMSIAVLIVVALVACWFPAYQATRVDPIVALRVE